MKRLTRGSLVLWLGASIAISIAVIFAVLLVDLRVIDGSRELRLLDLGELWRGLGGERSADAQIFYSFRLPRVLAGAVVGAGLAAAGCAFQAVLRNPLAEPYTLGISSGSALAAVLAIRLGIDRTVLGTDGVGLAALLGAGVTVWVVWRLGKVGSSLPPATLLLAGITIAMFSSAASMLVQHTADFAELYRIVTWMMGGLDAILYGPLARTAVAIAIGVIGLLSIARDLNALSAGADAAASVGVNATRAMTIAFFSSSLIVGASIAIAGPIGFIGLLVPHALRAIVGPDHRALLPTSIIVGAAALVLFDGIARELLLPVGVVTAMLGAPFFLYLILRKKTRARLWGGQ